MAHTKRVYNPWKKISVSNIIYIIGSFLTGAYIPRNAKYLIFGATENFETNH